jgi:tight adherence protein C
MLIVKLSLVCFLLLVAYYSYLIYRQKKWFKAVFEVYDLALLTQKENEKYKEFKLKLTRGGITQKEFIEIIGVAVLAGISLFSLVFIINFSPMMKIALGVLGLSIALLMPFLYLEEQIKARIKRIDNDLAIFIDLLIIILEGGGGLNNAIDEVTIKGTAVLGKDLLEESKRFKNELITYSSEVAYANLVKRTGSEAVATIVGYMKLSEETGIGVKSIFENQSEEIKSAEMLSIEKKAATMNISITFTMFLFILPAIIAMVAFPMAADALMPKF